MRTNLRKVPMLLSCVRGLRECRSTIRATIAIMWLRRIARKYRGYDGIVIKDRPAGLFSIYFQSMAAYYIGSINKQKLFLQYTKGPYFSSVREENSWWDYYFDMSQSELYHSRINSGNYVVIESLCEQHKLAEMASRVPRALAHKIVEKFPLRVSLHNEINLFVKNHFQDSFVIGVHYRGTDKVSGEGQESHRIDYSFIGSIINQLTQNIKKLKVFVATDELEFISYMKALPVDVLFTECLRSDSDKSIHLDNNLSKPDVKGREAIIDCHLLAKCDFLLRTNSNLSKACEFINPDLEVINLSYRQNDLRDVTNTSRRITEVYQSGSTK